MLYLLVFAGFFGKRVVAVIALVEMPLDASLMQVPGRRRRRHRAPRPIAPVRRRRLRGRGDVDGRGRRLVRWRRRYGLRMRRSRAAAGHYHAPKVDGGRIAVSGQVIVGPGVRVRGGGPQVVMVMVVRHFDGFRGRREKKKSKIKKNQKKKKSINSQLCRRTSRVQRRPTSGVRAGATGHVRRVDPRLRFYL